MKTYDLKDIPKIINDGGYKYCGLFTQNGSKIIPYNSNRIKIEDRIEEIIRRIEKGGLPDGYYCIKCKTSYSSNATADDFYIYNGEMIDLSEEPTATIIEEKIVSPNVLTYESALKLNVELASLKLENKALKNKIEDLEIELAQLEEDDNLADAPKSTFEQVKDFGEQLINVAAPLLDRHFKNKEMELTLKAQQLPQFNNMPGQFPNYNTSQDPHIKQTAENSDVPFFSQELEEFIFSPEHNENEKGILEVLFYNSESEEDFMKKLNDANPELCGKCKNMVYGQ